MSKYLDYLKGNHFLLLAGLLMFLSIVMSFSLKIMNIIGDGLLIGLALYFVHMHLSSKKNKDKE